MQEIEKQAWEKKPPSVDAPAEKIVVYCIARAMYADYESGKLSKKDAQQMKLTALSYYELVRSLALSNSKIIHELALATAPRKDLVKKDKAGLLDIIARIEGVATGVMKSFESDIPEFLKLKEDK